MASRSEPCRSLAASAGGENSQPLVETRFQPVEAERGEPCRGELDRQCHAVQRLAQRRHPAVIQRRGVPSRGGYPDGEQVDGIATAADDREPRDDVHPLVREQEPGAAGRQHGHARAARDDHLDAGPDTVEHVLAVVENEQCIALGQRGNQGEIDRGRPLFGDADRLGNGRDDHRRVGQVDQVREPHAVAAGRGELGGDAQREPGLADSARTGRSDERGARRALWSTPPARRCDR